MQRFFTDTLQSDFIKSILCNTPLYTLQTCRDGDFIIESHQYIYTNQIITCTKSGYIHDLDELSRAEYRINYLLDDRKLSKRMYSKHVSTYNYYDSLTHKYLGEYLRLIRDLKGIDLMPFYNCFCNLFTSGVCIFTDINSGEASIKTIPTKDLKIALVPVKLNLKYTIAIDSTSTVLIAPVFLNNNIMVLYPSGTDSIDLTQLINNENYSHMKLYNNLSYNNPILYEFNLNKMNEDSSILLQMKSYERFLYLLIQLPANNDSCITVLEGDYTDNKSKHIFSADIIDKLSWKTKNKLMLSKLSLLSFNCRIQVPFSIRLIEYLTENVITNNDIFWKDISTVQERVDPNKLFTPYKGVWDDSLRVSCFNRSLNSNITRKFDLNGFVDKDVENMFVKDAVYNG